MENSTTLMFMCNQWYVYYLRCADNTVYTGVTTDLNRRIDEHNNSNKLGAKYTRARRPVHLIYEETLPNRQSACQREYQLRKLAKKEKEKLACAYQLLMKDK